MKTSNFACFARAFFFNLVHFAAVFFQFTTWNDLKLFGRLVSFAAVIRVFTQCSSPTNGCSLELYSFPFLLRTNNMHVTVSSCTNHISRYICRQSSRFPRNGGLLLIGEFKERNADLEWAAVSGEEHCVTNLITAARETSNGLVYGHFAPRLLCSKKNELSRS